MIWNFQNSYTKLPNIYYRNVQPDNYENAKIILFNKELAEELNLKINNNEKEICEFLLGKNIIQKVLFPSLCRSSIWTFYNTWRWKSFNIGEHLNKSKIRYDIQLKGSGRTPYSRNGDGKAVLGPMIREYLVSEAMHHMNIPSTRALAVISTGEKIFREKIEPGAILVRVAKSHIRVGTFQFGSLLKDQSEFISLINYTISRLFPDIENNENKYLVFLKEFANYK